jgi:O-glycosyl hydrolase
MIKLLMKILFGILTLLCVWSCNNGDTSSTLDGDSDSIDVISININEKKQTIRNFGASDAWACQFVGNWPDAKRDQIARWLFSKDVDDGGQPLGIGLSLWRFNIGAGSAAQTNISDPWRRTEGFLQSDGHYDWAKQSGQQWFLQAAREHGVENLLAFTNSPPIQLTKNGNAFSSVGDEANIAPDKYLDFSRFLVTVLEHFQSEGLNFNYVSPFNEPQWDWTGNGQEGSPYKNTEIFAITKLLDSLLDESAVNTKIQVGEAGKLNYLYEKADKNSRGDQINEFFNNNSNVYLGAFNHVDKIISGHSYFTSNPVETLVDVRTQLGLQLSNASVPIEFWQSEYCILGGGEEVNPNGKDLGITPALYVARIIHHDLTVANASAWHWWLAVSVYDYKDGLIYADKNTTDGKVEASKTLWALGNFSRFIRPGAQRITVTSEEVNVNNPRGLMISSYMNTDGQLVVVAINYSNAESTLRLDLLGKNMSNVKGYVTGPAQDDNLKPMVMNDLNKLFLPARSIVTLVGQVD